MDFKGGEKMGISEFDKIRDKSKNTVIKYHKLVGYRDECITTFDVHDPDIQNLVFKVYQHDSGNYLLLETYKD